MAGVGNIRSEPEMGENKKKIKHPYKNLESGFGGYVKGMQKPTKRTISDQRWNNLTTKLTQSIK